MRAGTRVFLSVFVLMHAHLALPVKSIQRIFLRLILNATVILLCRPILTFFVFFFLGVCVQGPFGGTGKGASVRPPGEAGTDVRRVRLHMRS